MKRCGYCAKEIGYHEMYCCDDCQIGVNEFDEKREKFQTVFSIVNGVCVLGVGICIFMYSFLPQFAAVAGPVLMMILGAMCFLLPFPADVMIERFKLKKAIFITRIIAGVLFAIGAAALVMHLLGVF